jgi:hypothetical protein
MADMTVVLGTTSAVIDLAIQAMDAKGTTATASNVVCESGQGSPRGLPRCSIDAVGAHITMLNPAVKTGSFDGVQLLDATVVFSSRGGLSTYSGEAFFAGTVEGCGEGTVYFEVSGEGSRENDGTNTFTSNTCTAVPGGTLPLTGTLDEIGTEVLHDDGTATLDHTGTY